MYKWRCTSRDFVSFFFFYHHDISIVTYKCVSFTSQCPVIKEAQNKYNANGINKYTQHAQTTQQQNNIFLKILNQHFYVQYTQNYSSFKHKECTKNTTVILISY
jgi:hypothetical protein